MNLSVGDILEARDLVEYAAESKLLPQIQDSIKCQKNPKLLAVLSCDAEPALNALVGMSFDQVSELCLVAQVESKPTKHTQRILPGLSSIGYTQVNEIPADGKSEVQTESKLYGSGFPRLPRIEAQGSKLPRQAVDIRRDRKSVV